MASKNGQLRDNQMQTGVPGGTHYLAIIWRLYIVSFHYY